MNRSHTPLVPAVVAAFVLFGSFTVLVPRSGGGPASPTGPVAADRGPVIVELFTSQGCSSCPSADRLLSRLAGTKDFAGVDVIPLAYHVDYWNYIGWQDPFSSSAWSERQRSYARALGHGRVYTPQLVVDGATDCVGSDAAAVERQIAEASRRPSRGSVQLEVGFATGSRRLETEVVVDVAGEGSLDLMLVLFENDLRTPVLRGENAKRTLHNDFVVRHLEKIASFEDAASAWRSGSRELDLDPDWNLDDLGVSVFLQDPVRLTIHGAAVAYPTEQGS